MKKKTESEKERQEYVIGLNAILTMINFTNIHTGCERICEFVSFYKYPHTGCERMCEFV